MGKIAPQTRSLDGSRSWGATPLRLEVWTAVAHGEPLKPASAGSISSTQVNLVFIVFLPKVDAPYLKLVPLVISSMLAEILM